MRRIIDLTLIAAAIGGAIWTYQIKHDADLSAKQLASINRQIDRETRKIALLEADWAIATAPERLEKLATRYGEQLGLQPLVSHRIVGTDRLPDMRPLPEPEETLLVEAEGGRRTFTGGIAALLERSELLQ